MARFRTAYTHLTEEDCLAFGASTYIKIIHAAKASSTRIQAKLGCIKNLDTAPKPIFWDWMQP